LIREIVQTKRPAAPQEVEQILDRMATAAFDPAVVPVRAQYRGLTYQGITLGRQEGALALHLVLRVVADEQWANGTAAHEYLTDLRDAIGEPSARLLVYYRRGGYLAAVLAPNTVPPARRGAKPQPQLFVVYSADRGIILSGYQSSGSRALNIPGDALWLR
jgi:hypothetical protein